EVQDADVPRVLLAEEIEADEEAVEGVPGAGVAGALGAGVLERDGLRADPVAEGVEGGRLGRGRRRDSTQDAAGPGRRGRRDDRGRGRLRGRRGVARRGGDGGDERGDEGGPRESGRRFAMLPGAGWGSASR